MKNTLITVVMVLTLPLFFISCPEPEYGCERSDPGRHCPAPLPLRLDK